MQSIPKMFYIYWKLNPELLTPLIRLIIPVKEAIAFGKKIVKVWMMMMEEEIFAGHPSLALPPSTFPRLHLPHLPFPCLHWSFFPIGDLMGHCDSGLGAQG